MLYLSTFLQCNCIFLPKIVVILNKTYIFAVYYYNTQFTITIKTFATMKKQAIQNFKVLESTSTRLCIELTSSIRLCGQRHSDRRSGSSVWVTHIEKYGKWKVFDNPFCRNDYSVQEKWGIVKANTFRGVVIAKRWSYKDDIITALNSIPTKPISNN